MRFSVLVDFNKENENEIIERYTVIQLKLIQVKYDWESFDLAYDNNYYGVETV